MTAEKLLEVGVWFGGFVVCAGAWDLQNANMLCQKSVFQ